MMTWVYSCRPGLFEFVFEQLRRTADPTQGILDFVHQVPYQLAAGVLLLDQALLASGS
jgi:hypothetical protein